MTDNILFVLTIIYIYNPKVVTVHFSLYNLYSSITLSARGPSLDVIII